MEARPFSGRSSSGGSVPGRGDAREAGGDGRIAVALVAGDLRVAAQVAGDVLPLVVDQRGRQGPGSLAVLDPGGQCGEAVRGAVEAVEAAVVGARCEEEAVEVVGLL